MKNLPRSSSPENFEIFRFSLRSRVRVSGCLSGRCCRIFGMRFTKNDPSLASPGSYIAPRLWRAARDPWNPRKGRRQDGEQRRVVGGVREAARSSTWHTYCLPFGNLEPKGFSLCSCRERRSMIEKLIFKIKSLIVPTVFSQRSQRPIATIDREAFVWRAIFYLTVIVNQSAYFYGDQGKERKEIE